MFAVDPQCSEDAERYCQNLCLLGKLWIDHKTLYFDNEGSFIFYVFLKDQEFIGYYSKETDVENDMNYNHLSCVMVLPLHQQKGYGTFISSFAYLLAE